MNWEDLKNESTEDLIEYMKCKVDSGYIQLAQSAYVAFNFRFRADAEDKGRKIGKYWNFDRETCDQLVEKAFKRFYQYPFKFTKTRCGDLSINDCVKLYLYKIIQRCFINYHNQLFSPAASPYDGTEQVVIAFPALESLSLPDEVVDQYRSLCQSMAAVLDTLTPNHKIIYLTYKAHEKEGFRLSRELLRQLREVTGLKQSSIRVYKKQVIEKMREFENQNGEQ